MFDDHTFRRRRSRLLPGDNLLDHLSPLVFPSDTEDFPTLIDRRWLRHELPTAFATEREVETCS